MIIFQKKKKASWLNEAGPLRGEDWRRNLGRVCVEVTFKTKGMESHTETACTGEEPLCGRDHHIQSLGSRGVPPRETEEERSEKEQMGRVWGHSLQGHFRSY